MKSYLLNPLCYVWAFLVAITVAAWWFSRSSSAQPQLNTMVTLSVLLISAVKVQLVMRYFMELGEAPRWLRLSAEAWLLILTMLLLACYFVI